MSTCNNPPPPKSRTCYKPSLPSPSPGYALLLFAALREINWVISTKVDIEAA
jgi:hypothetical protein